MRSIFVKHIAAYILPPLVVTLALVLGEAWSVYSTGICPGQPPDIPPRPCSLSEFFTNDLITPFGIIGMIMLFAMWAVTVTPIYWGCFLGWRFWSNSKRKLGLSFAVVGSTLSFILFWMHLNIYY